MGIRCFMLDDTAIARRWLRRYRSVDDPPATDPCPIHGSLHQECVLIEDAPMRERDDAEWVDELDWPRDDPRWPKACPCGYVFGETGVWQLFYVRIYRTPDGREVTLHPSPPAGIDKAPAGSLWWSTWCPGVKKGPGPYLWAMLPNDAGEWCIDGPSMNGGPGWTRTGEPPNISVQPSINAVGAWHGFLTGGELTGDGV